MILSVLVPIGRAETCALCGSWSEGAEDFSRPCSMLRSDTRPGQSEPARESWPGSLLGCSDESMVGAVQADVIPANEAAVVNGGHLRSQGVRRVNGSEDTPIVDKAVRDAQSVVVPSCYLTAVVDGERDGVDGARRLDMAEDAINAHHGVSETSRLIGGKPAHVSLLIDPIKPSSERAGKADVSEDAVLPDESVRRGGSFRRDTTDSHRLPPVVHLDDGGSGRTGIVNGRENVVDHDEAVPSQRKPRIVAVNAPEIVAVADRRQTREPGARHVELLERPVRCREKPAVGVSSGIGEGAHHSSRREPEQVG